MDLRTTFNEEAANYDKYRPTYCKELFDDVICFSGINDINTALEIGIGTGQATLPILKTGCKVTAIELGKDLSEYSKQKFSTYSNFEIINTDFEKYEDTHKYDFIYSATAFHWVPAEIGYPKVFQHLKSRGTLALFWNRPFAARDSDPLHVEIQKIYAQYRPSSKKLQEYSENDCEKIAEIIRQYGFVDVTFKLYHQTREFDAKSYISLLNTYSDHRAMKKEQKIIFENKIAEAIDHFSG